MSFHVDFNDHAAVLFDCDGTLVNTGRLNLHTLQFALGRCGLSVQASWCLERIGLSANTILRDYERYFGSLPLSYQEILNRMSVAFRQNVDGLEEITMVADVARAAQGIIPIP